MSDRPAPPSAEDLRRARRAWQQLEDLGGLAGPGELAQRWDAGLSTVKALVHREGFPAPVITLGGRSLWLTVEADQWRAQQPQRGRPPKTQR